MYFPTTAIVSSVCAFEDGSAVEMVATGREGMIAVEAVLGSETALSRQVVQVPGSSLMIDLRQFRRAQDELPFFSDALLAYSQAVLAQALQSAACNGVHAVQERAARWLLMCHDRSDSATFALTQSSLAEMLGVSRQAVSIVARALQQAELIRYRRGEVTILSRRGLEQASCECYGIIRQHYDERLLPSQQQGRRASAAADS
ncbi:Crp/Fnr family transcriptional regulator [Sinorhizobium sp. 8-89]|uniref:Crp/Fnr family transcriptional regulator n=1 Tax=Sinorhizobium TaxID=28105 RepID=UPI001569376A|nr:MULTISPECIES: Crp/Fnr family transcriptional regulator [Sinorhizobium]MDK1388542.1 Crp/Fnr family transcriptional regulator [Sinorhizobium sp. 7-81]